MCTETKAHVCVYMSVCKMKHATLQNPIKTVESHREMKSVALIGELCNYLKYDADTIYIYDVSYSDGFHHTVKQ